MNPPIGKKTYSLNIYMNGAKLSIYENSQLSIHITNIGLPITPVSYTHLDVYKRQVLSYTRPSNKL